MGVRAHPERAGGRRHRRGAGRGVGGVGGPGGGGGVPDRRDHQDRRPAGRGPGVGVGRPDVDAAAAAAELLVPAGPVVLDLRRGHDQPDDQAGPQARDDDHGDHLPVRPDIRRREVPRLARRGQRRLGPGPCRGRRRAADRERRGDDRDGRADHAAGGAVDRPVAVPGRVGHPGARGAPAQVAVLHAPGHGHHHVRPGPGHTVPRGGLRGADLGHPARRLARRPGGGGAAGDAARADGRRAGCGQDARHRDRRGLLRSRAGAVGRRQQRGRGRTRRGHRVRAEHRHEHRAAQGRHRGDHRRGVRARQGPRRRPLHDLPAATATRPSEHTGGTQPWRST